MLQHAPIYPIIKKEIKVGELDERISLPLAELEKSLLELGMYIKKEDYDLFEKLTKNFLNLNSILIDVYFNGTNELIRTANGLSEHIKATRRENKEILFDIYKKIRETYLNINEC